jgi:hypothetical protein
MALAGLWLAGCTSIPQRELRAYRQAFDQVRTQSESLLADYAQARQAKSNLLARMTPGSPTSPGDQPLEARLNLRPFNARTAGAGVESDVEVRLRAWEVAARYNQALEALATGRSGELEAAANGLLEALKKFPIKEVSQAVGEAVPYAGAIVPLLELLQREIEARRFRQAVLLADPHMKKFVQALFTDADRFYEHRRVYLQDRYTFGEESFVVEAAMEFQNLLNQQRWGDSPDVADLVTRVNAARALAGGAAAFPEIKFKPAAGVAPPPTTDSTLLALRAIADRVQVHAQAARRTAAELRAYHELMQSYAQLLQAFEVAFRNLKEAAESGRKRLPSVSELETVIASVRVAYTVYTQTH